MRFRLSRPCYDKFHRCPGWAGGGPKYGKRDRCGYSGSLNLDLYDDPWWRWKFWGCRYCNTVVWPYVTRYLSIPWQIDRARWRYRDWRYRASWWWQDWREERRWRRDDSSDD